MKVARIIAGREKWKRRAIERGTEVRRLRRLAQRVGRKLEAASERIAELESENAALREAGAAAARAPATVGPPPWSEVRVVVVLVFAVGLIPCNALMRSLSVLRQAGWLALASIPDPSSAVNWVARTGLGMLAAVSRMDAPWVAIIDSSISYGKAKMLVVLRVPLAHFGVGKGAVTLADTECIGLVLRESWTGEDVRDALVRIFGIAGFPAAIIKDQGTDLKLGVALLRKAHKGIAVIRDIGHVCALLLKHDYERNPIFVRFIKLIDAARSRLCNGEAASLRPPKIRAKGRFQGISRVVDWASRMADLLKGSGRAADGSLRQRVQRAMPGLCAMRFFFARFARDCTALNGVMELLKARGLNQETYRAAKAALQSLPASSRIRRSLTAWLDETLRLQCRLGIGQLPLLVSSDVIESLFGIVKAILERTPAPEFGTLALATPLLCGQLNEADIRNALARCPHKTLTDWKKEHLSHTNRRVKQRILENMAQRNGPDPERAMSA
jgi:hypothetical protein